MSKINCQNNHRNENLDDCKFCLIFLYINRSSGISCFQILYRYRYYYIYERCELLLSQRSLLHHICNKYRYSRHWPFVFSIYWAPKIFNLQSLKSFLLWVNAIVTYLFKKWYVKYEQNISHGSHIVITFLFINFFTRLTVFPKIYNHVSI